MEDEEIGYHPELDRVARGLPSGVGRKRLLPILRALAKLQGRLAVKGSHRVRLPGTSVYLHEPTTDLTEPRPAVLWLHGGGLIGLGDPRDDDALRGEYCERFGAFTASVEYAAAPEHPFPRPLDDCVVAFDWLVARPEVDPNRVVVVGVSGGGGLAAALCQRLEQRGGPQPCLQVLIYPMLDDRSAQGSSELDRFLRMWDRPSNDLGWSSYLRGHDRNDPPAFAVPARTENLAGLPPAWIGVGTLDLFYEECCDYARRLREAGVAVDLKIVEGAFHAFDKVSPKSDVVADFVASHRAAVSAALG